MLLSFKEWDARIRRGNAFHSLTALYAIYHENFDRTCLRFEFLVRRRLLYLVDDDHIDRSSRRFQFQPKLLLQGREERRCCRSIRRVGGAARLGTRSQIGRKLKSEIKSR